MKYLILIPCVLLMFSFESSLPTTVIGNDKTAYGNVQDNYPGGQDAYDKYIRENVHYPEVALANNIQGCSYVQFVIEIDGSLSNVETCRGIGSGMDEETVRLVKRSGKWIPNMVNGNYVKTKCRAAVHFILEQGAVIDGTASDPDYLLRKNY
jgi:hypothetical protein